MNFNQINLFKDMKQYVILHAEILGIAEIVKKILSKVHTLDEDRSDSWSKIFYDEALTFEKQKKIKIALGLYNIARFPFARTPIQYKAYQAYIDLFYKRYCNHFFKLEKLKTFDGLQEFYIKYSKSHNIIIICGGILALKEQWINLLNVFFRLGFTVVLTEMPSVGQNNLSYNKESFHMFSDILDVIDPQKKCKCHLIALSFSGYIAVQNSYQDNRITAITMAGAPIYDLYHDFKTFNALPILTKVILAHNLSSLLGNPSEKDVFQFLDQEFLFRDDRNEHLKIFYSQSKYDEVISLKEADYLQRHCQYFNKLCLPDVHGSPHYHKTVIFYIIWSVLFSFKKYPHYFVKVIMNITQKYYQYIYENKSR